MPSPHNDDWPDDDPQPKRWGASGLSSGLSLNSAAASQAQPPVEADKALATVTASTQTPNPGAPTDSIDPSQPGRLRPGHIYAAAGLIALVTVVVIYLLWPRPLVLSAEQLLRLAANNTAPLQTLQLFNNDTQTLDDAKDILDLPADQRAVAIAASVNAQSVAYRQSATMSPDCLLDGAIDHLQMVAWTVLADLDNDGQEDDSFANNNELTPSAMVLLFDTPTQANKARPLVIACQSSQYQRMFQDASLADDTLTIDQAEDLVAGQARSSLTVTEISTNLDLPVDITLSTLAFGNAVVLISSSSSWQLSGRLTEAVEQFQSAFGS
ncbi:MAG: hypothetical protein LBV30_09555 [Propionibacteriaceae bacterium]|jgi:hypothetical protein|nr:hypothetical protein [Propionibacteriaceae bacterium]